MTPPTFDPDDTPTPAVSASYAIFAQEAHRIAAELDRAAALWTKRIDMVDTRAAAAARDHAGALRVLGARFAAWPTLDPEVVARERRTLTQDFFRTVDAAIKLVETLPSHPALGPPARYR